MGHSISTSICIPVRTISCCIGPTTSGAYGIASFGSISVRSKSIVPYSYTFIVSVDCSTLSPHVVISVLPANRGIRPSNIISVRPVPRVTYGPIKSSVWSSPHITEAYCRSGKPSMERAVYITSIINVDEACIVAEHPTVIEYVEATQSMYPTIRIGNINPANLGYTTKIIIKYGYVLYLDDSSVVIILYKWVIVKS